jgi:hypothetical protein
MLKINTYSVNIFWLMGAFMFVRWVFVGDFSWYVLIMFMFLSGEFVNINISPSKLKSWVKGVFNQGDSK